MTAADQPSAIALQRLDALVAAGYAVQRRRSKVVTALSLHHPSRHRRRGAPPSLLLYEDGLIATYPQERQGRLRFAADNAAVFDAFLNLVPSPSYWELAAPTVKLVMVFGTLAAFGGVVLWAILNGQVAVTGFVVHLILFSAPFMAIRLFLK
ncbi:MAG: hypothetical protein O3C65_15570 [Proteobacteria bacterium]|nr:hypothetical protein [Pseudomonadota bacterium]